MNNKNMPFTLSKVAQSDFNKIVSFTSQEPDKHLVKRFDDTFRMLSDIPLAGCACDEMMTGCPKYTLGKHVIFYVESEETNIHILRILHKSLDIPSSGTE